MAEMSNLYRWAQDVADGGTMAKRRWNAMIGSVTAGTVTASRLIWADSTNGVTNINVTIPSTYAISLTGTQTVNSGGIITVATGGHLRFPVTSATSSSTGTAITNFGITTLDSTTAGTWTLADPTASGLEKWLVKNNGTTTVALIVTTATTNVTIATTIVETSTGGTSLTWSGTPVPAVHLISSSTSKWRLANTGFGTTSLTSS